MTRAWFIREYKKGDELNILELIRLSGFQREYQRTVEHWSWKYVDNPCGHLTAVAECNGQLVGSMGLSLVEMKAGDLEILGSQAADLIVHSKFRRQGIFLSIGRFLLNEAGKKGIAVSYGFPNEQARKGHLRYGWFDVCNLPRLIKPVNMNNTTDIFKGNRIIGILSRHKISRAVTNFALKETLNLASLIVRMSNPISELGVKDFRIRQIDSFDDRVDDLWNKVSKNYEMSIVRSRRYLNWRYFDCPNVKYTVLIAERDGEMLGYIVLLCRKEGSLTTGHIVDIFASINNGEVVRRLIIRAIEYFKQRDTDVVVCWMMKLSSSGLFFHKILRNNGFVPIPGEPTFFIARVNSPDASLSLAKDSTKWFITKGDSDQI